MIAQSITTYKKMITVLYVYIHRMLMHNNHFESFIKPINVFSFLHFVIVVMYKKSSFTLNELNAKQAISILSVLHTLSTKFMTNGIEILA